MNCRHLLLVLGDQLDHHSSLFEGVSPRDDLVWMAEVREESTHVWSHKARTVLFLSAMRHFARELRERGLRLDYTHLGDEGSGCFRDALARTLSAIKPSGIRVVQPGDFRVLQELRVASEEAGIPLEVLDDRHFLCTLDDFRAHARGRKQLRMEYFYREMRRRHGVLMDGDAPEGGKWNFDEQNRESFGKQGPSQIPAAPAFSPDEITKEVIALVENRFPDHPGSLGAFAWPVTRHQALEALDDFIRHRLGDFGRHQDAMWTGEPFLYHSRLSTSLNLKLLHPNEVIDAAEAAYRDGRRNLPLAAVEGFVRQILGWREYVRAVYWTQMPDYAERNFLNATHDLPAFFWTGNTDMECLKHSIGQTLEYGYAHHIQRLMVTGLYALLFGVEPRQVHEWYLAVYVDAVEWVELPNTIGMSQFADGGVMASKPYVASGKYIERMSNYCQGCRYNPAEALGESACPFTTLYWDFLLEHEPQLRGNQRMAMQLRNLSRLSDERKRGIRDAAAQHRETMEPLAGFKDRESSEATR